MVIPFHKGKSRTYSRENYPDFENLGLWTKYFQPYRAKLALQSMALFLCEDFFIINLASFTNHIWTVLHLTIRANSIERLMKMIIIIIMGDNFDWNKLEDNFYDLILMKIFIDLNLKICNRYRFSLNCSHTNNHTEEDFFAIDLTWELISGREGILNYKFSKQSLN